jgi:hypothetical protein
MIEEKEIIQYTKETNSEDVLNDTLLVQEIKYREGWCQMTNLENDYSESSIYNSLSYVSMLDITRIRIIEIRNVDFKYPRYDGRR